MTSQMTLAGPAEFSGVGIHTGREGRVRVCPAPAGYGVRFLLDGVEVPAVAEHVVSTQRCTVLGAPGGAVPSARCPVPGSEEAGGPAASRPGTGHRAPGTGSVATIEHLLAALYGLGIDNAHVEVDGPEVPILDGSAFPFVEGLLAAGLQPQEAPARVVRLSQPIWLQGRPAAGVPSAECRVPCGDKAGRPATAGRGTRHAAPGTASAASILALPADRLTVTAATDFGRKLSGPCVYSFTLVDADEGFARELAPARTFCFQDEVAALLEAGIGLGGSAENTIVVAETGTSTPLRFTDEMTRHKALDLLGDLGLVGARLAAHVIALRAGHTLHVAMADAIRQLVRAAS